MTTGDGSTNHEPVPLETLREWRASSDPLLHHLAFHMAFSHPERVSELCEEERLEICLQFLEAGLSGRYGDRIPDGPYTLGHTTLAWLRALSESGGPADRVALAAVLSMLERLARDGDAATRDVIVLGVVEHAFEEEKTRALFAGWASDPTLAPLYEEAARLSA